MFSKVKKLAAGAALSLVALASHAAVTTAQLEVISDDVEASMLAITPWILSLLAITLGAAIGIKLVKKFSNKAS